MTEIDYTKYTLEELLECKESIDGEVYPERLAQINILIKERAKDKPVHRVSIADEDGNIASITNNSGLVDNLEYDNKNSYYNLLYPEAYRKINFWSNNNVVSRSRPAVTIDIEYNSQNYPTRRTSSYIDHNGVNQTVIYEYFYE